MNTSELILEWGEAAVRKYSPEFLEWAYNNQDSLNNILVEYLNPEGRQWRDSLNRQYLRSAEKIFRLIQEDRTD